MADSETNDSSMSSLRFSNLLCQEHNPYSNEPELQSFENPSLICFVSEEEDEYFETMFKKESFFFGFGFGFGFGSETCSTTTQAWLKSSRSNALDWLFNAREKLGFNFRTLYLSITYFDRFLSKRHIDNGKSWAIRLLSVACLSLAAKIEECNVPILSEFPIGDFEFESKFIQRMELLVLSELEWKMGSLTPFSYLNYFVNKFGVVEQSSNELIVSSAVELIMVMTKETKLTDYRPCIVAASAVLVAMDGQLTRKSIELKINVIKLWLSSQDMEEVFSCCNVLKEIEKRKVKTPGLILTQCMVENTLLNSDSTTKRRLSFNESGQSSPAKKVHRT